MKTVEIVINVIESGATQVVTGAKTGDIANTFLLLGAVLLCTLVIVMSLIYKKKYGKTWKRTLLSMAAFLIAGVVLSGTILPASANNANINNTNNVSGLNSTLNITVDKSKSTLGTGSLQIPFSNAEGQGTTISLNMTPKIFQMTEGTSSDPKPLLSNQIGYAIGTLAANSLFIGASAEFTQIFESYVIGEGSFDLTIGVLVDKTTPVGQYTEKAVVDVKTGDVEIHTVHFDVNSDTAIKMEDWPQDIRRVRGTQAKLKLPFLIESAYENPGFDFVGWSLTPDNSTGIISTYEFNYMEDKTMYAIWRAYDTLVFDLKYPDGTPVRGESMRAYENTNPVRLPEPDDRIKNHGLTFLGWKVVEEGSYAEMFGPDYQPGDEFFGPGESWKFRGIGEVVLKGEYAEMVDTVTLDINGKQLTEQFALVEEDFNYIRKELFQDYPSELTVPFNGSVSLPTMRPNMELPSGIVLNGWSMHSTINDDNNSVLLTDTYTYLGKGNVTLYAVWGQFVPETD